MKITSTSDWREEIPFETPMIVAGLVPGDPTRCSVCGGDSELRPRTELWAVKHRHPNQHAGFVRFYCQPHLPVVERIVPADDEAAVLRLALELLDDLSGRARADVGVDQRLLEALPGLLVEVALEQRRLDLGGERLARLAHVLAQPLEEAAALLGRRLGLCRRGHGPVGEEEVCPIAGHRRGRIDRHDFAAPRPGG